MEFITSTATGAAANADSLPVGVLIVNGVDNAASVTVTNVTTGRYKASVTLPALTDGEVVEMGVTATIGGVAAAGVVARDTAYASMAADIVDGVWDELTAGHTATGSAGKALSDLSGASGGTGANVVTVTVTGNAAPLEGANVRLTLNATTYLLSTDTAGQAVFSLDSGTYTMSVSLAGWAFTPTSVVVDGTEAVSAAMTQVVVPTPTEPDTCVVYLYARDQHGAAAAGVGVQFRLESVSTLTGSAYEGDAHTVTSAADGLVQMQLPQGAWAALLDTHSAWRRFRVPAASSYELPSIII